MGRQVKLRGPVVVLAISGSLGGAGACGNVADDVGKDAGSLDATAVSPGDVMVADATLDGTLDAPGEAMVADATLDVLSAPEAGAASGMDATPDSAGDVAVADVALDAPSGPEAGDSEPEPPSCAPGGPGMTNCGPGGSGSVSCCTSLEVEGGTYFRTYDPLSDSPPFEPELSPDGGPTGEADPATVSSFRLDEYLVTVGRFRQFVKAWSGGYYPTSGSGKHTHLKGGQGLANSGNPGTYEAGWSKSWNNATDIDPTTAKLQCYPPDNAWTASAGSNESLPINCVNWWEAYAFCIWDGGFLPSEAEWEYAAAAGNQQREYPWGSTDPAYNSQYAIYLCNYGGFCIYVPVTHTANSIAPVGYASLGAGYFKQFDLAGEVSEWNLDTFVPYVNPCTDCAFVSTTASDRVFRGGSFDLNGDYLLPSVRLYGDSGDRAPNVGFRCARSAP